MRIECTEAAVNLDTSKTGPIVVTVLPALWASFKGTYLSRYSALN